MAASTNSHRRSHSLLLLQKLLNLRDTASPLTLLLDSLEQTARPVLSELTTRAKIAKTRTIFLSFSTLKKPRDVDVFIKAAGKDLALVRKELLASYPPSHPASSSSPSSKDKPASTQRAVVVIDSLNALASSAPQSLALFLSGIITPVVSVVAVYHLDVPVILPRTFSEYEPHPFALLCHLATAILRLSSLWQEIGRQRARDRSIQEPEWGLAEGREGVLLGLTERGPRGIEDKDRDRDRDREREWEGGGDRDRDRLGVLIDMELRRRSGRTISEKFILMPARETAAMTNAAPAPAPTPASRGGGPGRLSLLADHPVFAKPQAEHGAGGEDEQPESTFDMGLTEKQRRDREGIVLPYFDAQTDIGAGEGGRILYEMGREDDFDEEEDEI